MQLSKSDGGEKKKGISKFEAILQLSSTPYRAENEARKWIKIKN
jgi:hypothetical protein